jgi:hypothetical protein
MTMADFAKQDVLEQVVFWFDAFNKSAPRVSQIEWQAEYSGLSVDALYELRDELHSMHYALIANPA